MAKSWPVPGLAADRNIVDCARSIIHTRWREMLSHRERVEKNRDTEAVHDFRVSCRRLRTAMKTFAPVFADREFRYLLKRVDTLAQRFGRARDLDVVIEFLDGYRREVRRREQTGIRYLIERRRQDRMVQQARLMEVFARLDRSRFAERFEEYFPPPPGENAGVSDG